MISWCLYKQTTKSEEQAKFTYNIMAIPRKIVYYQGMFTCHRRGNKLFACKAHRINDLNEILSRTIMHCWQTY